MGQASRRRRGRGRTVQGDGEVAAPVGHTMETELVGHVGHFIFFICLFREHSHRSLLCILIRERIASLRQTTVQDLHQAVRLAVIVDGAALARRPNEHQLSMG